MASALERLKKAAIKDPIKKTVQLSDGGSFDFWHTSLTIAERERAAKASNGSNETLGLQLLIAKALDENGERMFLPGQMAELKNEVRSVDLERMILALIEDEVITDQGK